MHYNSNVPTISWKYQFNIDFFRVQAAQAEHMKNEMAKKGYTPRQENVNEVFMRNICHKGSEP